ncbi:hypothetical protein ABZ368_10300 [Streptomyces sp. NPDC005908]|nr:hypothetical protein [Streptomyces sp. T12]
MPFGTVVAGITDAVVTTPSTRFSGHRAECERAVRAHGPDETN